jgi:hypothetical protein
MEFLRENRNIVIIVAVLVIGYLLMRSEVFGNVLSSLVGQWESMTTLMKLLVLVIVVALAYRIYQRKQ